MRLHVARWGDGIGVRLPEAIAEEMRIGVGSQVDGQVQGGVLQIRPIPSVTLFRLDELMAQISSDNIPDFERWTPVGREIVDDDDWK